MPLYLVRWPNLSCSLVRAEDEDDVLFILDELSDTTGARITLYDGPLFLDLTLPTDKAYPIKADVTRRPLSSDDVEIGDVSRIAAREFTLDVPETDTGYDMVDAMLEGAFPHLHAALADDFEPTIEAVEEAVRAEALVAVQASWRREAMMNQGGEDAELAATLGVSMDYVEALRARIAAEDETDDDDD